MPEKTVGYGISITRSHTHPGWVTVALRKQFWSHTTGSRSRDVATAGFYAEGMSETDIVESCLRELLLAYCDRLS